MGCCIQVMKRGIQGSNTKATTKTANNSICIAVSVGEYLRLYQKYNLSQSKLSRTFIMESNAFHSDRGTIATSSPCSTRGVYDSAKCLFTVT